jgi:hypothetical protein
MLADEYRVFARLCLWWAGDTKIEEDRQRFLVMAEEWRQLAEKMDSRTDEGKHPLTCYRPSDDPE